MKGGLLLPQEVENFFNEQRREQKNLNTLALVNANLRDTVITMQSVVEKTNRRGTDLEMIEQESELLVESSKTFLKQTKYCNWWWCWCCRHEKGASRKSK
jgi:hypothetical protein